MGRPAPWLVLVATGLLLALALWWMRLTLGPVVAIAGLFLLLWPYRAARAVRRFLLVAGLLLLFWILSEARTIVYPALAAFALAYLLNPVVNRLDRLGVHRGLAALGVLFPLLALLLLVFLVLIPELLDQARLLIEHLPHAYRTVVGWLQPLLSELLRREDQALLPTDLSDLIPNAERILHGLVSGLSQVGRGVAAVVQVGAFLLLTPILTYYLLVDFERLVGSVYPYVPPAWADRLRLLGARFQESVAAWFKGQLLVALILAALHVLGFLLIGLPYALLLGLLAGLLNLVPILGFWIAFVLALTAALFGAHPLLLLMETAGVMLVAQILEQNLLGPRLVGRQLGVKPIVLLLVMLMLSVFMGVLGVLLAAPAIGLARGAWALWGPSPQSPAPQSPTERPPTG